MNTDSSTPAETGLTLSATKRESFHRVGTNDTPMFEVREGIDPILAIGIADGLDQSVRELLQVAVMEGLDSPTSFLCLFAMNASSAIRTAVGAVA